LKREPSSATDNVIEIKNELDRILQRLRSLSNFVVVREKTEGDKFDVITVPMKEEEHQVSCWMDIMRGTFPFSKPLEGPVKVGENLTMAIYIKDRRETTDLRVKDCYAYDSREDAVRGGKPIIKLTSEQGCPINSRLIDFWKTTTSSVGNSASVVAYTTISAFKFPGKENVFLSCNVELCTNGCMTFCSEDPNQNQNPHTLAPAFTMSDMTVNMSHRHFANFSFAPIIPTTTTTPTDNIEREFELLSDQGIRKRTNSRKNSRIHRITSSSASKTFNLPSSSEETEDMEEVDLIFNGDVNPKADFARLVFQENTTTPPENETTTSQEETTTNMNMSITTMTDSETTTSDSSNQTTTQRSMDSTTDSTTSSMTNDSMTTTDSSETTTGRFADLNQAKQVRNATEDEDFSTSIEKERQRQNQQRKGKASQELQDDTSSSRDDDTDSISIKPIVPGVKGGSLSGTKGGRVKESLMRRKFPAFLPRPPAATARLRKRTERDRDRIGSASNASPATANAPPVSRRSSGRSRRRDSNRRRRRNNGNTNNSNITRRKLTSSSSSSSPTSSVRHQGSFRMEPLPRQHDPGFSDIPFRASRVSTRYAKAPNNNRQMSYSFSYPLEPSAAYNTNYAKSSMERRRRA